MGVREALCFNCRKWFNADDYDDCPNCEVKMTQEEKELVESVGLVEGDFYAGLLALALYRFAKSSAAKTDFMLRSNIENIVISAYEDLNIGDDL